MMELGGLVCPPTHVSPPPPPFTKTSSLPLVHVRTTQHCMSTYIKINGKGLRLGES